MNYSDNYLYIYKFFSSCLENIFYKYNYEGDIIMVLRSSHYNFRNQELSQVVF